MGTGPPEAPVDNLARGSDHLPTVVDMTTVRVDADGVLALGASLAEVAAGLAAMGDPGADRWAVGPGESGPALEELLGGWQRTRLQLAAALADLGDATVGAGGLYVDTEAGVSRSLIGGGR